MFKITDTAGSISATVTGTFRVDANAPTMDNVTILTTDNTTSSLNIDLNGITTVLATIRMQMVLEREQLFTSSRMGQKLWIRLLPRPQTNGLPSPTQKAMISTMFLHPHRQSRQRDENHSCLPQRQGW